ncbi:MAG TPA: GNAT family N-acetyltransferase [Acidimicrobiia bacterium]|nr:GNAT family N-acetyltransferase [Acidimicrobiia bacterium]
MITVRTATIDDHPAIVGAIQEWWGDSRDQAQARELSLLMPRLFLQHFARTSLVAEHDGELVAFLVGFHSPDRADEAYVHFVGVSPHRRRERVAEELYERFLEAARRAGRRRVRAVTSPQNAGSIAFHRAMGFHVETNPADGGSVFPDYDGPGQSRVCFVRKL